MVIFISTILFDAYEKAFILGAFQDLAESTGVTSNKNVIRACGIGTVQHALLKKQQNPREGSAVFNWVKKIREGLIRQYYPSSGASSTSIFARTIFFVAFLTNGNLRTFRVVMAR